MTQQAFAAAALPWHDFFLAAAGASAALLGLLFVGVSINLAALATEERVDLRARAGQAFANLTFVLVIALIMLIPDPDPHLMGISLGLIAGFGLLRVAQNVSPVVRGWRHFRHKLTTMRRIGWTVIADLLLALVAWRIWSDADATADRQPDRGRACADDRCRRYRLGDARPGQPRARQRRVALSLRHVALLAGWQD